MRRRGKAESTVQLIITLDYFSKMEISDLPTACQIAPASSIESSSHVSDIVPSEIRQL